MLSFYELRKEENFRDRLKESWRKLPEAVGGTAREAGRDDRADGRAERGHAGAHEVGARRAERRGCGVKEEEIKETLAKQLQLLHERSKDARNMELVSLTDRMILLANYLDSAHRSLS